MCLHNPCGRPFRCGSVISIAVLRVHHLDVHVQHPEEKYILVYYNDHCVQVNNGNYVFACVIVLGKV